MLVSLVCCLLYPLQGKQKMTGNDGTTPTFVLKRALFTCTLSTTSVPTPCIMTCTPCACGNKLVTYGNKW